MNKTEFIALKVI